jgi:chorismate mutase
MVDYFSLRDLTANGEVFNAQSEDNEAILRPLLELVRVLCEKNAFGEDSPVEVTLTITRVPRAGSAHCIRKR